MHGCDGGYEKNKMKQNKNRNEKKNLNRVLEFELANTFRFRSIEFK